MKKQSEHSIVINVVTCSVLTMQAEYKCLAVEKHQMCSLSDGTGLVLRGKWGGER
jgi:hypothetical protein